MPINMRRRRSACESSVLPIGCLVACLFLAAGCRRGPGRIEAPDWDPDQAAAEALRLYDTNQDDSIAGQELDSFPALRKALGEIDTDPQDGKVSAAELEARIAKYADDNLGRMGFACRVTRNNRPLPGAKVTFEPEPFLADVIQPATGVTNNTGVATLSIEGVNPPGITVGFYKVRISKQDQSGKELLPPQYNRDTILGQELSLGSPVLSMGRVTFDLK